MILELLLTQIVVVFLLFGLWYEHRKRERLRKAFIAFLTELDPFLAEIVNAGIKTEQRVVALENIEAIRAVEVHRHGESKPSC